MGTRIDSRVSNQERNREVDPTSSGIEKKEHCGHREIVRGMSGREGLPGDNFIRVWSLCWNHITEGIGYSWGRTQTEDPWQGSGNAPHLNNPDPWLNLTWPWSLHEMLESIHTDAITDPYRKASSEDHHAELETPEKKPQSHQNEQNRSPSRVIGNGGKEAVGPRRNPYPVNEDLQLLVHMEDSERQNQK